MQVVPRSTQPKRQVQRLDGRNGTLMQPVIRRAPYTYEDDGEEQSEQQEFSQRQVSTNGRNGAVVRRRSAIPVEHRNRVGIAAPRSTRDDPELEQDQYDDVDPVPAVKKSKKAHSGRRVHWLVIAGSGMVFMILLVTLLSSFIGWFNNTMDNIRYGNPRTYQFDAVVGHNDSTANPTHFICINLNRHVEIIEFPGGDTSHARIYNGPILFGDGQDLTPVTGKVVDVNRDGKPDLILIIQNQKVVFINTGTEFRPLRPGEYVNIPTGI